MVIGWMWSNFLASIIQAVAVGVFFGADGCSWFLGMGDAGYFAELISKMGFYITSVPPVVIALSFNPSTALRVAVFFIITNKVMGDFVIPKIRASTMNLHPVSTLVVLLALGSAFGLIGAFIATPITAFI